MAIARESKDVKKWKIARRAQLTLKQRLERVDFEEDILAPEVEALLAGRVRLQIEANSDAAAQSIIHMVIDGETDETGTGSES